MTIDGDVRTFESFVVTAPSDMDPSDYDTVVVWCESSVSSARRTERRRCTPKGCYS